MNLIISDFDGTFFDDNYMENIKFIENNNFDFVIATGRNYKYLKKDLKIKCKYYICNDGGYILDSNKKIIYRNSIDNKEINIAYKRMLELNYKDYFFDTVDNLYEYLPNSNINKLSIKIKSKDIALKDMNYILNGLKSIYGYISENWINILSIESKKEKAIEFILNNNKYDDIYVIGNETNDYNMLTKYNGYLISDKKIDNFNCIKKFIDIKNIINK